MPKEKRSFLERLTGSKTDPDHQESRAMPVYAEDEDESPAPMRMTMSSNPRPTYTAPVRSEDPAPVAETSYPSDDSDGQLTIDMYQTESEIVIKSTIAGVKPEDLDVAINNDMITVRGERSNEEEVSGDNFYYQECYWGSFSRSVVLPVDVLPEKAEASLKNGILTVRLPKADTNKVKKIQVRGF